jgi:hypothetical protein
LEIEVPRDVETLGESASYGAYDATINFASACKLRRIPPRKRLHTVCFDRFAFLRLSMQSMEWPFSIGFKNCESRKEIVISEFPIGSC